MWGEFPVPAGGSKVGKDAWFIDPIFFRYRRAPQIGKYRLFRVEITRVVFEIEMDMGSGPFQVSDSSVVLGRADISSY